MSETLILIIENGSFVAISLICFFGAHAGFKHRKTVPGADLAAVGLLLYGTYSLLAFSIPGFTGSYFCDYCRLGRFESATAMHFISFPLRFGLILVVVGLFRIARSSEA